MRVFGAIYDSDDDHLLPLAFCVHDGLGRTGFPFPSNVENVVALDRFGATAKLTVDKKNQKPYVSQKSDQNI